MLIPLIVLDDGETYSGLDGCSIVLITNDQHTQLCNEEVRLRDIKPVSEFMLQDFSPAEGGGS